MLSPPRQGSLPLQTDPFHPCPTETQASYSWLTKKYFFYLKLKDVTFFIVKRDIYQSGSLNEM